MLKLLGFSFVISSALLTSVSAEEPTAFVLHVTHVKTEYVGDKPTQNDCKKIPCTTLIITVDAHSMQTDYVLECKQWVLLTAPVTTGKCWSLEATKEYPTRRSGRTLLFYEDTPDTNPLYMITEETERKQK